MVHTSLAVLASKLGSRAGSRLRLVKSPVTLTEAATDRIKELLQKRQKVSGVVGIFPAWLSNFTQACHALSVQEYLKLGIKRRGCNGLAYTLNYAGILSLLMQSSSKRNSSMLTMCIAFR